MADQTAQSIRSNLAKNFDTYMAELKLAGPHWETKPSGSADGEKAWCARQVAEHIAGAGRFFGAGIAQAIAVSGPTPAPVSLASAADAIPATQASQDDLMKVANQVRDDQLVMEINHPQLGKQTLGSILGILVSHLDDHANQLKTLRGG
jgi:hypothetical protein